jgi:hypothetical protein
VSNFYFQLRKFFPKITLQTVEGKSHGKHDKVDKGNVSNESDDNQIPVVLLKMATIKVTFPNMKSLMPKKKIFINDIHERRELILLNKK